MYEGVKLDCVIIPDKQITNLDMIISISSSVKSVFLKLFTIEQKKIQIFYKIWINYGSF